MKTPNEVLLDMAQNQGFDTWEEYFDSLKSYAKKRVITNAMINFSAQIDLAEGFEKVSIEKEMPPEGWNGITIHRDGLSRDNYYYGKNAHSEWHWNNYVEYWLRSCKILTHK